MLRCGIGLTEILSYRFGVSSDNSLATAAFWPTHKKARVKTHLALQALELRVLFVPCSLLSVGVAAFASAFGLRHRA